MPGFSSTTSSSKASIKKLRKDLLRWYGGARRDLPWRRTNDPYAIWVSEIMLQQTRVDTVIPYYQRFLKRFPTAKHLAEAAEDDVMSAWSGLGYYRRARLLHAGVREVVESYAGNVPKDPKQRLGLPGVGRYTAGAIGSIAFGKAEPVVDGNVARVLARVFLIETPLGKSETDAELWRLAAELVKGPRPGDLNQSVMELGALVCKPKTPDCPSCPVHDHCGAFQNERTLQLPVPKKRKAPKKVALVAVVVKSSRPKGVVLARGRTNLFSGLWSPPFAEGTDHVAANRALAASGISATIEPKSVGSVKHVLSHRALSIEVYRASSARIKKSQARRFSFAELETVGISSLTRKLLARAGSPKGTR